MAENANSHEVAESSGPSRPMSEAHSLDERKSKEDVGQEQEEGIEETFEPPRDEESGFHHHGGKHDPEKEESNLVDWDGPNDPEHPQNMSNMKKWWITMVTALMTFVVSFGSSIFSTATEVTAAQFKVSNEVMILGVTLYVVGFAAGPLVWGPMSEILGRRIPLMAGMFGFIIFQIPIGVAGNLQTIFICRFFGGAFGSAPLAVVPGMFVDFWNPVMRAVATNGFVAAVFAGPALGPIIGEFTVKNQSLGWHWTGWFTMIMGGFFFVLALPTVPETLAPVLLQKKAARLRHETKNWALHSKMDEEPVKLNSLMRKYGLKPVQMIIREPILIVMTIYISLVYGILYLIFFAFPISYEFDRGLEFGVSSLPFIAIFIGVLIACLLMILETVYVFQPKMNKAKKVIPEERLPPMMLGSVILVVGLFWFAWTSFPTISPWPQIISGAFIGCGIIMVFMPALIYLVDVYLFEANSALAANTCIRSAVAAAFPLFATYMYTGLGIQWASSLLAFLCLALVPAPFLLYKYGKRIRGMSKFAYDLG